MSSDTVIACPECDGTSKIRSCVSHVENAQRTHDREWYCDDCGTAADEPVRREPYQDSDALKGLAGELLAADPDAVGEASRETTKPPADETDTEQAQDQDRPGGSSQDDPGKDQDDLTQTDTSDSDKSNDRSTESSPSCGWRGVAREMGVEPGR